MEEYQFQTNKNGVCRVSETFLLIKKELNVLKYLCKNSRVAD